MTCTKWIVILSALFLSACSTTRLTDTWQEPEFSGSTMKDVLVVFVDSNTSNRTLFESQFVAELKKRKINAVPSYQALSTELPNKDQVEAYLKTHQADHVIVTALTDVDVETDYVPESVRSYYTGPYYPSYGAYWNGNNTVTMTREAYTDNQYNVILSTTIYDTKTKKPVWIGRSKTYEVGSVSYVADELATQMIRKIK